MTKPSVEDPVALQRFLDSLRDEGKRVVDMVLGHREVAYDASSGLDVSNHVWYALGMAYTFVGMDCSIIKIYAAASGGRGIDVPTAVMPRPVIVGDWPESDVQWYKILQGIPVSRADEFESFLQAFKVENRRAGERTTFALADAKQGDIAYRLLLPICPRGAFSLSPDGGIYFG